jgi:hypothetical protein
MEYIGADPAALPATYSQVEYIGANPAFPSSPRLQLRVRQHPLCPFLAIAAPLYSGQE